MRKEIVFCLVPLLAASGLAACVSNEGGPPPLPPLAEDSSRPMLALFEHVLTGYFAEAGAQGPTVCAMLSPKPLSAEQEEALILRFVRLAPADRCRAAEDGTWRDAITGDIAQTVRVYDFACREEAPCSGWAQVPGRPATRYTLRFEGGAWRFDGDPRIIAE
jgi:hypothetical protein